MTVPHHRHALPYFFMGGVSMLIYQLIRLGYKPLQAQELFYLFFKWGKLRELKDSINAVKAFDNKRYSDALALKKLEVSVSESI